MRWPEFFYREVDDIVEGILKVANARPDGYKIYNIGNSKPVELLDFINLMEKAIGVPAIKELLPMQPGDVYETYADTTLLATDSGYRPSTPLEKGITEFLNWYKDYYHPSSN